MSRTGSSPNRCGIRSLDDLQQPARALLRVGGLDEVEVRRAVARPTSSGISPVVDPVRVDDDAARGRLPEDLGQPHHRHRARGDDVGQHLPGPDRRQLIDVADQDERRRAAARPAAARASAARPPSRSRPRRAGRTRAGRAPARRNLPLRGVDLEQPVDGLGLEAGRLRQPLGGPAGRRARAPRGRPSPVRTARIALHQRRLADAGTAGDDEQLRSDRQAERLGLACGERPCPAAARPTDQRSLGVDRRARRRAGGRAAAGARRCCARRRGAPRGRCTRPPSSVSPTTVAASSSAASASSTSSAGHARAAAPPRPAARPPAGRSGRRPCASHEREADAGAHADQRVFAPCRAFSAIRSAVTKPMPWMSAARRYGIVADDAQSRRRRRSCRCAPRARCRRRARAGTP